MWIEKIQDELGRSIRRQEGSDECLSLGGRGSHSEDVIGLRDILTYFKKIF